MRSDSFFKPALVRPRKQRFFATALMVATSLTLLASLPKHALADQVARSIDVQASPSAVWSMIGPFCAVKDWLPPVGSCVDDGAAKPTRTLVTKDGSATFVELQTARNDSEHFYTYVFLSSPLPVTHYTATVRVAARPAGGSTVSWQGTYSPVQGKEKAANDALSGIYQSGLDQIAARFTER